MLRATTTMRPLYQPWPETLPDVPETAPPPSYQVSGSKPTSLDIPQRIEQKLAQYNASSNVFKRWLFELASWSTSAICIVSLRFGLLCQNDR